MPHGRARTYKNKVNVIAAKFYPRGYKSWLDFAVDTFVPPSYETEDSKGERFQVLNQSKFEVRKILKKELEDLRACIAAASTQASPEPR